MPDYKPRSEPVTAWNGLPVGELRATIERHQHAVVTAVFIIGTFLIYQLLGPPTTIYNNFVILGDAFLDGRVEITNADELRHLEFAIRDGKHYIIPPPWPAILLLPAIIVFGTGISQTFVSALLGGATAAVVYNVVRHLRSKLSTQIWLTALFLFGTVFFYSASDGSVWHFSHTVAVLFLFLAIYCTLVLRNPLLAGLCLGAAFWSRSPTALTVPFFAIMFSDQWLRPDEGQALWKRVDLRPLVLFGAGAGVFVIASFVYNYIRFETPLDASQHHLPDRVLAQPWFNHGPFDPRYVPRHVDVFFEKMPIFQKEAPYVLPSWGGMALWATTPAFLYALFAGVREQRYMLGGALLLFLSTAILISQALAVYWDESWATYDFALDVHIWPFYVLIAIGVYKSRTNRLAIACWAAVIPTALMLFTFAGTGFAQFSYRFAQDFMPFLFLLAVVGMGEDLKWHHKTLIAASILISLWGVLWIHQFHQSGFLDLEWVRF